MTEEIEIPFGAFDSETMGWTYTIPEGFTAKIEDGKIVVEKKPSEDEKIRKMLIELAKNCGELNFTNVTREATLAYLEKQKEHKPTAEEVLIRAGLKPFKDGNQWCILAGDNIQEGVCGFGDTIDEALYEFLKEFCKQKEQKFTELSEEDKKITESLLRHFRKKYKTKPYWNGIAVKNIITYLEKQKAKEKYDRMAPIYKDRESFESALEKAWNNYSSGALLVDGFEDNRIELAHAKGFREGFLFGNQQKPAEWSEEDEDSINKLLAICSVAKRYRQFAGCNQESVTKLQDWLKSLRPQPHWKPSEEQMSALDLAGLSAYDDEDKELLKSLYNDLKKL